MLPNQWSLPGFSEGKTDTPHFSGSNELHSMGTTNSTSLLINTEIAPAAPAKLNRWPRRITARFYEHYCKEAEGYDKDFIKKDEDDMGSMVISVRLKGGELDVY